MPLALRARTRSACIRPLDGALRSRYLNDFIIFSPHTSLALYPQVT